MGWLGQPSFDAVEQRGSLPALSELVGAQDFYAWLAQHPGFNGYDVGGSYFRFLLDTYGAARVRRYYCGVPPRDALGVGLDTLEKGWHARLDKVKLRPGLESLLAERAGLPGPGFAPDPEAKLDEKILGPAAEWKKLDRASVGGGDAARWEPGGEPALSLTGTKNEGDWCLARLGDDTYGDAIVRCLAEPLAGCHGVQIQLGLKCQALVLRGQGTFIYNEAGGVGHDAKTCLTDKPVEIVLRRKDGRASVWIDGKLVAEAAVDRTPAPLGVGCVGGPSRIRRIAVRSL